MNGRHRGGWRANPLDAPWGTAAPSGTACLHRAPGQGDPKPGPDSDANSHWHRRCYSIFVGGR